MSIAKTISVGQLRQNPTQMIRDVRAGEVYTLTDRGIPVADIAPHREFRWVRGEDVASLLRELGPDPGLRQIIEEFRDGFELRDPWERKI